MNRVEVEIVFKGHKIVIALKSLVEIGNTVVIAYRTSYSNQGVGLHSYTDPED